MKGYNTSDGYMGLVDGKYILFASEADYRVSGRLKGMRSLNSPRHHSMSPW